MFYTPYSVVNQHFSFNFSENDTIIVKMLCPNVFNCLASGHMMGLDFLALLWLGGAI